MTLANMTQAQTDEHNREHCRHIADELEAIAYGDAYTCPHCRNTFNADALELHYNDDADAYMCPDCDDVELEQTSMYDWLSDALDWDYTVTRSGDYKAARVLVACGGPNIYVDTLHEQVELYWWTDRAEWSLSRNAAIELDAALEELYEMR